MTSIGFNLCDPRLISSIAVVLSLLLTASCVSRPPTDPAAGELYEWYLTEEETANFADEFVGLFIECMPYPSTSSGYGQFIGCQQNEIYDVRAPAMWRSIGASLEQAGCISPMNASGSRVYILNRRPFLFFDRVNETVWFVSADFASDGASIPDSLRRFSPGPVWDPTSPKTFPAAMMHDRYFCLKAYTERRDGSAFSAESPWQANDAAYRRKGCSNDAFQNALLTSGTRRGAGGAMTLAVSVVNAEADGYCPVGQAQDVMRLNRQLEALYEFSEDAGNPLPDCKNLEPGLLCLSIRENLSWAVGDITTPEPWRRLMQRFLKLAPPTPDNWRFTMWDGPATPFRLGDLWIESSAFLVKRGPNDLVRFLDGADLDEAIYRLMRWNEAHYQPAD